MINKISKLLSSILVCFLLFFCKNEQKIKGNYSIEKNFPINIELNGIPIPEFDVEIGLFDIKKAGKYIITTKRKQDYFFTIFSSDYNKITDICSRGNGPNEFLAPIYLGQYEIANEETKIWILDRVKKRFVLINIDKTIADNSLVIDKQYDLSLIAEMDTRNLFYINDSLLIGSSDYEECKVLLYNLNNNKTTLLENLLEFPKRIMESTFYLSQNCMALKPDKAAFVSAFYSMPEIDLYKISGERYSTIFYKELLMPKQIINKDPGISRSYFKDIYTTDNHFYLLSTESKTEEEHDYYVLVFDWNGKAIAKLRISASDSFFIDDETRKIYTLYYDKEEENVMVYDIPNL